MLREWMNAARLRIRALFRRRQLEQDLQDELAFHLAMKAEKVGGEERARRQFGNATWFRETCRELWSLGRVEIWWQDLRYGMRTLRRSPAFTAVAALSLALGIGANTFVFSLINGVLLKSLPAPNPQELRVINWAGSSHDLSYFYGSGMSRAPGGKTGSGSFSYPICQELRKRGGDLAEVFAFSQLHEISVVYRGQAFTSPSLLVSDNFFRGLDMKAAVGRTIAAEDDKAAAPPVVVVGYSWWERHGGLDPGVLGRTVALNGADYTIVGVLPRGFSGLTVGLENDFYVPMAAQPRIFPECPLVSPKHWWVQTMARLRPGVDERRLQAALEPLFLQMARPEVSGQKIRDVGLWLQDGRVGPQGPRQRMETPLLMLLAVVGVVLLIACANLASLLLARGAARRHEMALRAAIGAGRLRLVRQLLTECLLVALAGGGLGLALALAGKALVTRSLAAMEGPSFDFRADLRVLAFTASVSVVSALLFGLVPALRAARRDPSAGLKSAGTRGAPRLRLGKALIVVQVSLSLTLLAGASLLLRSLVNLMQESPGFRAEGVLLFRLNARTAGYQEGKLVEFYERVRESVAALPGVQSATLSDVALLSGGVTAGSFTIPGRAAKAGEIQQANQLRVGDSFLATMGIPLLTGRDLTSSDNETAPMTAVVNETLARTYFAGESPVGRTIRLGEREVHIVGLCHDAKYDRLEKTPATIYLPYRQGSRGLGAMFFEVRTAVPPLSVASAVRRIVAGMDQSVPLTKLITQAALIERSLMPQRWLAGLCGIFAGLALALTCIGLHGVMAYTVTRRAGEIGVRMALGAARGDVVWMVLREALLLAGAGAALGIPAALAVTRLTGSALYGVKPNDPATLAGAVVALLAVAVVAAWVPSRRAARLDPVVTLRSE